MRDFLDQPLADAPIVVIDTETTGLSPALGHRIVEVAALRLEGWREVARLNQLVDPGRPIDPGASRVSGIYDEDVAGAPPFSQVAQALSEISEGAILVAHNAPFDAGFLALEYGLLDEDTRPPSSPWLCTLRMARRLFYFSRNSLGAVAYELGVPTGRAHRAMNDARTTAEVLRRMAQQVQRYRLQTIGDLLQAQGGPIYTPAPPQPDLPPALAEALARNCPLRIRYQSGRQQTDRVIEPLYPTERDGKIYVVAYCQLRHAQRTFRLDRIVSAWLVEQSGE
ncbi:MAG: exonuclease domain-containing protein [Chloroflexota bacterium]